MNKIKVLIFPAGAENAIEIYEALRFNVNIEVYGASGKADHASFIYPKDRYIEGDFYINKEKFIDDFNSMLVEYGIEVVIPTHDTIAMFLAQNKARLQAKVLTADYETTYICRNKEATYKLFQEYDFCPLVYDINKLGLEDFPVFLKPNIGEGAKGAYLAKSFGDIGNTDGVVISEYLPGDEFTIDCFTNRKGELLFIGQRSRERIQMGIAFHSEALKTEVEIKEIASIINSKLKLFGAWFFQVKKDRKNKYKLMEISCRQAGTMTLYRHKGVNFSMLGIFELLEVDTKPLEIPFGLTLDRCIKNRFKLDYVYENIYVDFDDTVITNNGINLNVISFLYKCRNENKKIILITRHEYDLETTFERYKIHKDLFDEIIHITFNDEKYTFISSDKSIFIDNSFKERELVLNNLNIPVFDVDAVDIFL